MIDYPDKLSAVVFTRGCNLRCPFCHNPSLVLPEQFENVLPNAELFTFLETRIGKLDAVTFTGGEPLIHNELVDVIEKTKKLGFLIKLDTNGTKPIFLEKILSLGIIDYVAMDLKGSKDIYSEATGGFSFYDEMLESMDIIRKHVKDYEFRTTVVSDLHNQENLMACLDLLSSGERYCLQQFQSQKTLNPSYVNRSGLDSLTIDRIRDYAISKGIKITVR